MIFAPLGDSAVVVTLAEDAGEEEVLAQVTALAAAIRDAKAAGVHDVVPAFGSVAVFYDLAEMGPGPDSPYARICALIGGAMAAIKSRPSGAADRSGERRVEVPVVYGGETGPDLEEVAAHTGLSAAEVVAQHSGAEYRVQAIGFAPGFPYLSGLPRALATPRRATPRTRVAAGSVGIGGEQTGIYPRATPGGWQIVGRTDLALFDVQRAEPALLRVGDRVTFVPVEPTASRENVATEVPANTVEERAGLRIINAGMLTTVQDLGRVGQRAWGVARGGAMDATALRLANLLVGNDEGAAGLEFTLVGPEIEFAADALIAIGGAKFSGANPWRPIAVQAGQRLSLGAATRGCRGYLAVAGGLGVPEILGSRGTDLRGGFGGWQGRALRAGDVVPCTAVNRSVTQRWWLDPRITPEAGPSPVVRAVAGAHAGEFAANWTEHEFKIAPQSDRMGLRLQGPALVRTGGRELQSAPVAPGTVQVPPDGQPIVLAADAQTIGGYPRLAHVIDVDLPVLAQLRPGDTVRFQIVPLAEAHQLWLAREHMLALLREGLRGKIR
jgi:KipI family sensor histidine kinase inhibitor